MTYWTVDLHQAKLKLSIWYRIRSHLCCNLLITAIVQQAKNCNIINSTGCTPAIVDDAIMALKTEIRDIHNKFPWKTSSVSLCFRQHQWGYWWQTESTYLTTTNESRTQKWSLPAPRLCNRIKCQATNHQLNPCSLYLAYNCKLQPIKTSALGRP